MADSITSSKKRRKRSNLSLYASRQKRKMQRHDKITSLNTSNVAFVTNSTPSELDTRVTLSSPEVTENEKLQNHTYASPKRVFVTPNTSITSSVKNKRCRAPSKKKIVGKRRKLTFEDEQYEDRCAKDIREMSSNLARLMSKAKLLYEFMAMLQSLCDGSLQPNNIAFLLCLERAKFSCQKTSTTMTYFPETLKFWKVVYRILKGKAIRLFSGPKHCGHVTSRSSVKGQYNPLEGQCNFAVPSVNVLRTNENANPVPNEIHPGIIPDVVNHLSKYSGKDFVLAIDGKKVAQGLDEKSGDIDLWGHEVPNLANARERLQMELDLCSDLVINDLPQETHLMNLSSNQKEATVKKLQVTAKAISKRLKDLREIKLRQHFLKEKLVRLKENNPDMKDKYTFALANIEATMHQCRTVTKKALEVTGTMCWLGSEMGEASHAFCPGPFVDLVTQENVVTLKEPDDIPLFLRDKPNFVKQRTDKWHELRKQAPVTGSTLHNALGLRRLKDQKMHIQNYLGEGEQVPHPPEVQERMLHGKENEEHALATLAATVVPFLFPNQYVFEEGCQFISGRVEGKPLIEVSCDGTLRTSDSEITSILEIKCPFEEDFKLPVHYTLPKIYVCQMLAEMVALRCDRGIFVSYHKESTTVHDVVFDRELWEAIKEETTKVYGVDHITSPKHTSEAVSKLRDLIQKFVQEKVTFLIEVPSQVVRNSGMSRHSFEGSPYLLPAASSHTALTVKTLEDIYVISQRAREIISEADLLCRRKASEVLAFVITDTDRLSHPELFHHMPIAYGLKGYSLTTLTLRKMCNQVKQVCFENGINVVCESFDGQWHNLCVRDRQNKPLNRLELQKDVWREVQKMTKSQQLTLIKNLYVMSMEGNGLENIVVKTERSLIVTSMDKRMHQMTTPNMPTLWQKGKKKSPVQDAHVEGHEIDDACVSGDMTGSLLAVEEDPDPLVARNTNAQSLESDESLPIVIPSQAELQIILTSLKNASPHKWRNTSIEQIKDYLNFTALFKRFKKKELIIVIQALRNHAQIEQCAQERVKVRMACKLATAFGDVQEHPTVSNSQRRKDPPKLASLCYKVITSKSYPKAVLNVAIAKYLYPERERAWETESPVSVQVTVGDRTLHLFSRPEFCNERNKLEPRVIDPSHLLVNNRTRILSKGIQGIKSSAFAEVCDTHPSVINHSLVVDILDKQNVAYAQRVFSPEMEAALHDNGNHNEAEYARLIREWYQAIDAPGIPAFDRLAKLISFRDYLMKDVDFSSFPPRGQYIKGIPIVQFCGFIQNVDTRVLLYNIATCGTYNHRSIGTLAVESFFGDLTEMDPTGCPKATKVPRMMAHVTEINNFRHDSKNRCFHMATKKSGVYTCNPLDGDTSSTKDIRIESELQEMNDASSTICNAKDHLFDSSKRGNHVRRQKSSTISKPHEQQRGNLPVRSLRFKRDESKITNLVKLGINNKT